jgi:hypothetical protein
MVGTRCMAWAYERLGKVPRVQIGIVDGFEKVPGVRFGVVVSTRCAKWEHGCLRKVSRVRNGIVDGLERYPEYGLVDDC